MNRTVLAVSPLRRFIAGLVLAHLLAAFALAASPRLHHWVHPDEGDDDDDCAVVLFLHGGCNQAPTPIVVPVRAEVWQTITVAVAAPFCVPSVFAVCGILEHAPPEGLRLLTTSFFVVA